MNIDRMIGNQNILSKFNLLRKSSVYTKILSRKKYHFLLLFDSKIPILSLKCQNTKTPVIIHCL